MSKLPHSSLSAAKETAPIVSTADLAKYLNVSQWTVSRAINGHKDVSERTRQRVREAMEMFGFRPNPFARSLRGQSLGLIGLYSNRLNDPFMSAKLFALQMRLHDLGKRTLLESGIGKAEMEKQALEDFNSFHVDGVIMLHCSASTQTARELLGKTPFIYFDPHTPHSSPSLMADRYSAVTQLMEHLRDLGHRRFALLGISLQDNWRGPPLRDFARKMGCDKAEEFYFLDGSEPGSSNTDLIHGATVIANILKLNPRPTALVCMNDQVAFGAIHALQQAGLRVPEDFSVVGFNREEVAQRLSPTITTIDQKVDEQVRLGCDLLLRMIDEPDNAELANTNHLIKADLVIGESSGPPPR